ncbi:MAG: hypothetical protein V4662_11065 [Verrucomicrobiota bacterium]
MIEGDAEEPPRPLFQRFWFWMLICLLFVGPAFLCTGPDPMSAMLFSLLFGWIPFVVQDVFWKVVRVCVKGHKLQWALCLLIPMVVSGWVFFEHSFFYGKPRWVIARALKEPAPLLFLTVEFSEDAWTDYVARLRVHLDKDYLRNALEKHFERRQFLDGMPHQYFLKEGEGEEGVVCDVETDSQFSYALITYSVD